MWQVLGINTFKNKGIIWKIKWVGILSNGVIKEHSSERNVNVLSFRKVIISWKILKKK